MESVYDIGAVNADEITIVEYRRPLRDGCLGAVTLAREGMNPHLGVVALDVCYVVHHKAHVSAVGDKVNLLRSLLCAL